MFQSLPVEYYTVKVAPVREVELCNDGAALLQESTVGVNQRI